MRRRASLACLLAGLVLSLGCAQCASPWDYCGPVYAGGPCNSCVVDERMGSAFTAGPGMVAGDEFGDVYYEGEGSYEGESSAPYQEPYERDAEPMPTPADSTEPAPQEDDSLPPIEPPTFEEATPPLAPPGDDTLPPLEAPPSTARRMSFTAPAKPTTKTNTTKTNTAPKPSGAAAKPNAPAAVAAPAAGKATASPEAADTKTADRPQGWQAASSKGRFRR